MHYEHRSGQIVCKNEEHTENDDLIEHQKLLAKDPDILEKSVSVLSFISLSTDTFSAVTRKLGILLTKVAGNKHFQRIAALKPVAGVIEKLSNSDVGANIELMNLNGTMTVN